MIDALRAALESDERLAYALLFGSCASGTRHAESDLDVAIEAAAGRSLGVRDLGEIASLLESAAGRPVDLVLLDEAPPALAYRVFRDGIVLAARDRGALVRRKTHAILAYLDYRPIEALCARGVLTAASRGR